MADEMTIAEAAAAFGGRANYQSVWRWMRHGLLVGGRRVKLRCRRVGGAYLTTRAWVAEFDAALNPPDPDAANAVATPAEVRRADADAARELTRLLNGGT